MSTKVYCSFYTRSFDVVVLSCVQQGMVPPTRQCADACGIIRHSIFVSTPYHSSATCATSPDLSPCDIFLFPRLKRALKVHRYADIQAIQTAVTNQLFSIPESALLDCFEDFQKSWKRCIHARGSYFKRDP